MLYTATRLMAPQYDPSHKQHSSHGLRVYLDPVSGEFIRPKDLPALSETGLFARLASQPKSSAPIEHASKKAGGGYTINMQHQYRPSRTPAPQTDAGT